MTPSAGTPPSRIDALHRFVLLPALALTGAVALWHYAARLGFAGTAPGVWAPAFFAAVFTVTALLGSSARAGDPAEARASDRPAWWMVPAALCAGALAVYLPALGVGLLSDDFILLGWAESLELIPRSWEYTRPLPLLAWWGVAAAVPSGAVPAALHLLNVALHAVNACLVWRLAVLFGASGAASFAAAALFLLYPVGVEAVAWSSAIFDLLLATLALSLSVIVARQRDLSPSSQLLCVALGVLMLATKETGIVAVPLLLLVQWARWGSWNRSGYAAAAGLALVAALYAAWRAWASRLDPRLTPVIDAESVWRLLSQGVAALSVPLHGDLIRARPEAALAAAGALVVLLVAWSCRPHRSGGARLAVLAAASLVIATAPAMRGFAVLDDLQGSRYVYLPAAFWCIGLGSMLLDGWASPRARLAGRAVAIVAVVAAMVATGTHLDHWRRARRTRDAVLMAVETMPPSCAAIAVRGLPDNTAGAYVFRNGFPEALERQGHRLDVVPDRDAPPECRIDVTSWVAAARRR